MDIERVEAFMKRVEQSEQEAQVPVFRQKEAPFPVNM